MVDDTRWNTAQVLANGVLDRPSPRSGCPDDAVLADVDEGDTAPEKLREGLEAGGLTASMYYGCWKIWKTAGGFSGELMQYRNCTDSFQDGPLEEAIERAESWASTCFG